MGKFGKLAVLSSSRKAAKRNSGRVHAGVDKVASAVGSKVPERHRSKVDKGADLAKRALTGTAAPAPEASRHGR